MLFCLLESDSLTYSMLMFNKLISDPLQGSEAEQQQKDTKKGTVPGPLSSDMNQINNCEKKSDSCRAT